MSEENQAVDEPTVKFADDGKEHKVNDMPDEAKQLYIRWQDKRRIRDEFIIKANNDIDDLNTCLLYTSPSPRDVEESRMPSSA